MRESADQTGVAVCGADCRQDAGSGTAKRGHAAGAAQRQIIYLANVTTGKPDFLYVDEERPLILDTKYKPRYGNKRAMVTQHLGAMLDELDEKGRLRVRAVLAKAAKRTKQPYAGTALYSLAEDARATLAQDKELKGLALALCKPEANRAALIAATFGLEQDIMSCGY